MTRRFLNNFFSCHSKIDILRTIIHSEDPQSGRQIAARAGLSPRSCQLSLDELVKLNALNRTASGKAYYYSVNLKNQIVTDLIIPIVQQEEVLVNSVVESLRAILPKGKKDFKGVYFLESWPRKWGNRNDSSKLMAILKDKEVPKGLKEGLQEACDHLIEVFGMPSTWVIKTGPEFTSMVLDSPEELEEVEMRLRNVVGEDFWELVRTEKGYPEHLKKAINFFPKKRRYYS